MSAALASSSLFKLSCIYRQIPSTLTQAHALLTTQITSPFVPHPTKRAERIPSSHQPPPLRSYAFRRLHTANNQDRNTHPQPSPWNIANIITAGRIAIAPVIGYWIVYDEYDVALGGLMFAAISDWLDGILARRLKLHTVIGSYLDPAADKLLITISTPSLASQHIIPVWLAALIIGRDVSLITGWIALTRKTHPHASCAQVVQVMQKNAMQPILISKLNTTFQIALAFAGVLNAGEMGTLSDATLQNVGFATAITTCASGISYGRQFWTRWNHV